MAGSWPGGWSDILNIRICGWLLVFGMLFLTCSTCLPQQISLIGSMLVAATKNWVILEKWLHLKDKRSSKNLQSAKFKTWLRRLCSWLVRKTTECRLISLTTITTVWRVWVLSANSMTTLIVGILSWAPLSTLTMLTWIFPCGWTNTPSSLLEMRRK